MSPDLPLPFRLKIPGEDSVGFTEVRSISYRVEGMLHMDDHALTIEWSATRHREVVSGLSVEDTVEQSPIATVEVPRDWIIRAKVSGGWWAPRLTLWARRIEAFEGIPGSRPGALSLRIRRRDRTLAKSIAEAVIPPPGAAGRSQA